MLYKNKKFVGIFIAELTFLQIDKEVELFDVVLVTTGWTKLYAGNN